jgi:hypothetical protein
MDLLEEGIIERCGEELETYPKTKKTKVSYPKHPQRNNNGKSETNKTKQLI